jgi:hypothetical protein
MEVQTFVEMVEPADLMSERWHARGHAICGKASCSANSSEDIENLQHHSLYIDHPKFESSVPRPVWSTAAFDRDQRTKRKDERRMGHEMPLAAVRPRSACQDMTADFINRPQTRSRSRRIGQAGQCQTL